MRSKSNFSSDLLVFAPFTLLPSPFTKAEFEKAYAVQPTLNLLTHRVAYSHDFLRDTLKS
jgi:glutathione synthase